MKKIVSVTEIEGEGLESLLGEPVLLMCMNYSYSGILEGVNEKDVLLKDGAIVFETGPFTDKKWKDAQLVGQPLYVRIDKIEAYFRGK